MGKRRIARKRRRRSSYIKEAHTTGRKNPARAFDPNFRHPSPSLGTANQNSSRASESSSVCGYSVSRPPIGRDIFSLLLYLQQCSSSAFCQSVAALLIQPTETRRQDFQELPRRATAGTHAQYSHSHTRHARSRAHDTLALSTLPPLSGYLTYTAPDPPVSGSTD